MGSHANLMRSMMHFLPIRRLKSVLMWVIAVLIAVFIFIAAFYAFNFLSWIEFPVKKNPEHNIYSKCEDCMFVVEGINPSANFNNGINFLYKDGSGESKISYALIQSYFSDIFGNDYLITDLLELTGDSPFRFVMKDVDDGIIWAFSVSLSEPSDVVDSLHKSFADQFSPAVIRERTVPTGRVVRDVVVDPFVTTEYEERWRGYQIRESFHSESNKVFITASEGINVILGNDKGLVVEVVKSEPVSSATFFASASGLHLFSAAFPDSDVLRYAAGLLSGNYEDHLSLSSWQCIP